MLYLKHMSSKFQKQRTKSSNKMNEWKDNIVVGKILKMIDGICFCF